MNDHELDRLVASATHVRDGWVDGLDLRAAEDELMEEIMATTDIPVPLTSGPPPGGPPPDEPSTSRAKPRRLRLVVAVGAAAALVTGVVVARSMAGDSDDAAGVSTTGDSPILPMILDPVPDGFELLSASGEWLEPEPTGDGQIDTWLYGDVSETAVTNDVLVNVGSRSSEMNGAPVVVRGKDATLCSPGPDECEIGVSNLTMVSWAERPDLHVTVASRSFTPDQVQAWAEGLAIDGDTVQLGDVPPGVTKPPPVAELDGELGWAYMVEYQSSDGEGYLTVVTTPVENQATRNYGLWLHGPRDGGQVQGHPATLDDTDDWYALTWEPEPGRLIELRANRVDAATARAIAESVRPATHDEWTDLRERSARLEEERHGGPGMEPPEGAVYRQLAGGAEVWGWRDEQGRLCYQTGQGQLCTRDETDVLGVSPTNVDGQLRWDVPAAVGVAPEGTESVDGGEVTLGEPVDGGRLFVWEFSPGEMPDTLTFRDAAGNEIATREVLVL
jgi:hypothetical protein